MGDAVFVEERGHMSLDRIMHARQDLGISKCSRKYCLVSESRYRMNKISESAVPRIVVPTPKTVKKLPGKGLVFDIQSWKVLSSAEFHNEAKYLSGLL